MDSFIALGVALMGVIVLVMFKEVSEGIIKVQRETWHGSKPFPAYIENATRILVLVACLAFIGFGLYDGVTGLLGQNN